MSASKSSNEKLKHHKTSKEKLSHSFCSNFLEICVQADIKSTFFLSLSFTFFMIFQRKRNERNFLFSSCFVRLAQDVFISKKRMGIKMSYHIALCEREWKGLWRLLLSDFSLRAICNKVYRDTGHSWCTFQHLECAYKCEIALYNKEEDDIM
jgi:hypothetical protein